MHHSLQCVHLYLNDSASDASTGRRAGHTPQDLYMFLCCDGTMSVFCIFLGSVAKNRCVHVRTSFVPSMCHALTGFANRNAVAIRTRPETVPPPGVR